MRTRPQPANAAVIGAGRMGAGIGFVLQRGDFEVWFLVRDRASAANRLDANVNELRELGWWPEGAAPAYQIVTSAEDLPECTLVVESVPEELATKASVLEQVSLLQPNALIGTDTSSIEISRLATSVHDPTRFMGTHFWFPPPLMPLVELIPGPDTAPAALESCAQLLSKCGKSPVALRRDYPGFLWNRLQIALLREAKHLVDEGVASLADVDRVVVDGLARRWQVTGPFASAVLGGVATFEAVGRNLCTELSSAPDLEGLSALLAGYVDDVAAANRRRNEWLAQHP